MKSKFIIAVASLFFAGLVYAAPACCPQQGDKQPAKKECPACKECKDGKKCPKCEEAAKCKNEKK